jgi:hypothetical protein
MMRVLFVLICGALLSLPTASSAAAETVRVPRAKAPVVDGIISAGEWDRARVEKLKGGGEVLLQHDGEYLYVATRVTGTGIGSLCVPHGAKGVAVLHASAAIDAGLYEAAGTDWRVAKQFDFKVRDTGASPEAMKQRAAFLAEQGWFANTSRSGSAEREFQIAWKLGGARGLPLAVTYLTFPDEKLYVWPAGLDDASANPRLVAGYLSESARFDFAKWALVVGE